jgi:hypothetical protein
MLGDGGVVATEQSKYYWQIPLTGNGTDNIQNGDLSSTYTCYLYLKNCLYRLFRDVTRTQLVLNIICQ